MGKGMSGFDSHYAALHPSLLRGDYPSEEFEMAKKESMSFSRSGYGKVQRAADRSGMGWRAYMKGLRAKWQKKGGGNKLLDYPKYAEYAYCHEPMGTFPLSLLTETGRRVWDTCVQFVGRRPRFYSANVKGMYLRWYGPDVDTSGLAVFCDWLQEQGNFQGTVETKKGSCNDVVRKRFGIKGRGKKIDYVGLRIVCL
jgi:hypothetical protein